MFPPSTKIHQLKETIKKQRNRKQDAFFYTVTLQSLQSAILNI
jgi:hypothetical protein